MNMKRLKIMIRQQDTPAGNEALTALLASQKREREVFKRLSGRCRNLEICGNASCIINNFKKCTFRACPLLKGVK